MPGTRSPSSRTSRAPNAAGPPLTFARFAGVRPDRDVLREVTDEIMGRIAELSGQPVAAEPAPRVRPPA